MSSSRRSERVGESVTSPAKSSRLGSSVRKLVKSPSSLLKAATALRKAPSHVKKCQPKVVVKSSSILPLDTEMSDF
jgi:hypothetical protein